MRSASRAAVNLVAAVAVTAAALAIAADPGKGFRQLAPGVLTVIPAPATPEGAEASAADTVSRGDLLDITQGREALAWGPLQAPPHTTFVERGRDREYLRDVWHLEFAFKPPRMIDVEVPAAGMKMQRKRVWYLVYRVRNAGGRRPKVDASDSARRSTEAFETPIRFVPQFVLESLEPLTDQEGLVSYRAYLDRVLPTALGPIREREAGGRELLDSAAMVAQPIGPGEERWGVATWVDVDPRIDFFSIYVRGLTNAFQWRPRTGVPVRDSEPPGSAMEQALRTLRLDFWRPGDARDEDEEEMSVGFAGMFERMTLGGRLLEACGVDRRDAARPAEGLRALGLAWSDLLDPSDRLKPLLVVIDRIAAVPDPRQRETVVRQLFGDTGLAALEDIARALAAPADPQRDAERRAELAKVGLAPEAVERAPLESLKKILGRIDADLEQPTGNRTIDVPRLLGSAEQRLNWLARRVALARTLATLEDIGSLPDDLVGGDSLVAFDTLRPAVEAEADQERRAKILKGLFGGRGGPELFAAAVAVNEGIDHSWVFRYENVVRGP